MALTQSERFLLCSVFGLIVSRILGSGCSAARGSCSNKAGSLLSFAGNSLVTVLKVDHPGEMSPFEDCSVSSICMMLEGLLDMKSPLLILCASASVSVSSPWFQGSELKSLFDVSKS